MSASAHEFLSLNGHRMSELTSQLITIVTGVVAFFFGKYWDKKTKLSEEKSEADEAFKAMVLKLIADFNEFKIELRFKLDSIKQDTKPIEKLVKDMNALHARVRVVESRIDS
jgi:hypothetical protein